MVPHFFATFSQEFGGMNWTMCIALTAVAVMVLPVEPQARGESPETPAFNAKAYSVVLREGMRLLNQGRNYEAAIVFHKVLEDAPEGSPAAQEAEFQTGVALFNLGLYVSAFGYFDRVAEKGANHLRYREVLPYLVKVHREIPGERNTQFRLSTYKESEYPEDLRDEINYYVGQYYYYQGDLQKAFHNFDQVRPQAREFYPKALFLKAAVEVRRRKFQLAEKYFKKALEVLRTRPSFGVLDPLWQMTIMSLARLEYSMGKYAEAIRYYDQVSDKSEYWLRSLFERAWAYYKLGQYDRAMGSIQTVNAPYFEQEFYPEAHVLKAVILYRNCYFDEAIATIDPFYKEYFAVWKELKKALGTSTDPLDFYQYLAAISAHGARYSTKVKKVFNAALGDKRVRNLFAFVVQITKEIQRLGKLQRHPVARSVAEFLLPELLNFRQLTMSEAGRLARERLIAVQRELKARLAEALRVRFETLNAQKEVSSSELRTAVPEAVVSLDHEHVLWPFDGEYWKDELGSYYYPLPSRCPSGWRRQP